jgi:DNA-directed RNA polymerase specialized sigma24 family protein
MLLLLQAQQALTMDDEDLQQTDRICRAMLRRRFSRLSPQEIDDIMQEAWLAFFERYGNFGERLPPQVKLQQMMLGITYFKAVDHVRRKKRDGVALVDGQAMTINEDDQPPDVDSYRATAREKLKTWIRRKKRIPPGIPGEVFTLVEERELLAGLGPRCQIVCHHFYFTLFYGRPYTQSEVAAIEEIGISAPGVSQHLTAAEPVLLPRIKTKLDMEG